MTREQVIKGLECCKNGAELNDGYTPVIRDCSECPYLGEKVPCTRALARDALALLKEDEETVRQSINDEINKRTLEMHTNELIRSLRQGMEATPWQD